MDRVVAPVTRRTFLRVLGAAALAALAPSIPVPETSVQTWWRAQVTTEGPPLTLEMLEKAFRECSRGTRGGPAYLLVGKDVYNRYATMSRKYGLVYDVEV